MRRADIAGGRSPASLLLVLPCPSAAPAVNCEKGQNPCKRANWEASGPEAEVPKKIGLPLAR
jgi:hypothetical protein